MTTPPKPATNAPGITPDDMTLYKLTHALGHFMGKRHPAGTLVWGYPYPNDADYVEIITPDGYALTVAPGSDIT
jgi:hypothetical protein